MLKFSQSHVGYLLIKKTQVLNVAFCLIFIYLLTIITTFRMFGVDPDYFVYLQLLNYHDLEVGKLYEPTFEALRYVVFNARLEDYWFFGVYALLGVGLKVLAIFKISKQPYLSMLVYISMFYFLHEYTQIRAAVAIGVVLFSYKYIASGDLSKYIFNVLLASLFHYSMIIMIPVYFIVRSFSLKFFVLISIFCFSFAFFLSILGFDNLFVHNFLLANKSLQIGPVKNFNVMNMMNLSHLLLALLIYTHVRYGWGKCSELELVMLKLLFIGVSIFYFFGSLGLIVLAYRLSYIFLVVLIFLLPAFFRWYRQKFLICIPFFLYLFINAYHLVYGVILS